MVPVKIFLGFSVLAGSIALVTVASVIMLMGALLGNVVSDVCIPQSNDVRSGMERVPFSPTACIFNGWEVPVASSERLISAKYIIGELLAFRNSHSPSFS